MTLFWPTNFLIIFLDPNIRIFVSFLGPKHSTEGPRKGTKKVARFACGGLLGLAKMLGQKTSCSGLLSNRWTQERESTSSEALACVLYRYQAFDLEPSAAAWLRAHNMSSAQLALHFWTRMAAEVIPKRLPGEANPAKSDSDLGGTAK